MVARAKAMGKVWTREYGWIFPGWRMEPGDDYEEFSDPLPFKPEENFRDPRLEQFAQAMDRQILEKKHWKPTTSEVNLKGKKCVSA